MKRHISLISLVLLSAFLTAEEMPEGYYDAINGKKDAALKTALSLIIRGGERVPYGTDFHTTDKIDPETGEYVWHKGDGKPCTWAGFYTTDRRSDGTVWDMYSGTKRYFPLPSGSAAGMDIEHSLPKSWWGGNNNDAFKDLYHLCPADRVANNNKSNYPPGFLADSAKVNNGYFFMGRDTTWNDYAFDVSDEYKGDFARAYFYIATAYEDLTWGTDYNKYINNDSYLGFTSHLVDVLLAWHRKDPVSEKEVDRLNAISDIQHNRNAFIEYPDLVEYIWGTKKGEEVDLSRLTCTTDSSYEFPVSTVNPIAHEATHIMKDSFMAHWSNTGSDEYELDVFYLMERGKNDTLVAMPGFKNTLINATDKLEWLKADGTAAPFSTMDGSFATCMSTTTEMRQLRLCNFGSAPQNSKLDVKCSVFKGDQTADLVIKGDDDEVLYEQPLVLDEKTYTFAIPQGTQRVSVWQKEIGQKNNYHRISLQQVFLYAGDYSVKEISEQGFPVIVTGLEYLVQVRFDEGDKLYYRVTPDGLRPTNTVEVIGTGIEPEPAPEPEPDPDPLPDPDPVDDQSLCAVESVNHAAYKQFRDGRIVIVRNASIYTTFGQIIQ